MLRELTIADLHIVHSDAGNITVVAAAQPAISDAIQGKIRAGAEAFLAPKIVVCEGATEIGFLRGLDDHWIASEDKHSFAYRGVALFDANGASKIKDAADTLNALGYTVAVLADSDEPAHFSDNHAQELRDAGITVAKWADGLSIEERVFRDLPWAAVIASFNCAQGIRQDDQSLLNQVQARFGQGFDPDFERWRDTPELRTALGRSGQDQRLVQAAKLGP